MNIEHIISKIYLCNNKIKERNDDLSLNSQKLSFDINDEEYVIKKNILLDNIHDLRKNIFEIENYINNIVKTINNNEQNEIIEKCDHKYVLEMPFGPRDNGDYWYKCDKCGKNK
jgi:hypothetical protein